MNNQRLLARMLCAFLLSGAWSAFGQTVISLEEIFESAEAYSLQLRPSLTSQEEAEKEISVAKTSRLPDIDASLNLSYIGDGFTTKRNFSDYQKAPIPHLGTGVGLSVTQPVYMGGAITNSIRLAELKYTASRFATDMKRNDIRFQLTGFYLDIYRFSNLRGVVESNLESARKVLGEMKARYEQGVVLYNDITRYELLVSNLELQIIKIDNTLKIFNDNLVTIAGLPSGLQIIPDTTLLHQSLPIQTEQWWAEEATINSPALRLARTGIELSKTGEKLAAADRLPKIGLQAAWTLDGPILVEVPPINRNLSYWYLGVNVSYSLSSLYKTPKKLAQSRIATRKAMDELAEAAQNIDLGIRAEYVRYMESYEDLKTREKSVELAERNYHTVAMRYSEGMALITDMLDAADSRLTAEQQLVDSRIDLIYNYYKLLFTSGKL